MRHPTRVVIAGLLLMLAGIAACVTTPVDALPDLNERQVIITAEWPGHSAQDVEDQVTLPVSAQLRGTASVHAVRASSSFGFAMWTAIFDDSTDIRAARIAIQERLAGLTYRLPPKVQPQIGPDANGLGWVYQYYLSRGAGDQSDLCELRSIQDNYLRPALAALPGVAEIASIGGCVKQFQVDLPSARLRRAGVTMQEVVDSIAAGNVSVGGRTIEENGQEFVMRGVGLLRDDEDLKRVVVASRSSGIVTLGSVADIHLGGDRRRGALDVDGQEVVGGIVVMRTGANASDVIDAVKSKLDELGPGLATLSPGTTVRPFYDRSNLIRRVIATLQRALLLEALLVTIVHLLFLANWRSLTAVLLPLPIAIGAGFLVMRFAGVTSNLMSLAGLAIAVGILVDAGIVIVENVIRQSEIREEAGGRRLSRREQLTVTHTAARQVGRPLFFGMLIVVIAFLPVFLLSGEEGKLFHALAVSKTATMVAATVLAVTLVPALCVLIIRGPYAGRHRNTRMSGLYRTYDVLIAWALRAPVVVTGCAATLLITSLLLARDFGSEFMPRADEGSLLMMPVLLPSTAFSEVRRIVAWQDAALRQIPEVLSAAGKVGRADTATDPAPVEMIETTVELRPVSQWRPGLTRAALEREMLDRMRQMPGYVPGFLQPIEGRMLMISTGVRAEVGIKVFGNTLTAIQAKAGEIERVLQTIPGAAAVASARQQNKPQIEIAFDRLAAARAGARAQQVLDVVESGIGGVEASTVFIGRQRIPIQVRTAPSERSDPERLGDLLVPTLNGALLPLRQLATIRRQTAPNEIQSEDGRLFALVQCNVANRDLGSFVHEAQQTIARRVTIDPGISLEWTGQFAHQQHAEQSLMVIAPLTLVAIFLLLWLTYGSALEAAHVLLAIPFALSGGLLMQAWFGFPFSVAVWVGYLVLFGTAIQTTIVMVMYLQEARTRCAAMLGRPLSPNELRSAVAEGARLRLRPKLMTAFTIIASMIPLAFGHDAGSEMIRPLAAVVLGGMVTSVLHVLVLTPTIYFRVHVSQGLPSPWAILSSSGS